MSEYIKAPKVPGIRPRCPRWFRRARICLDKKALNLKVITKCKDISKEPRTGISVSVDACKSVNVGKARSNFLISYIHYDNDMQNN